MRLYPTLPSIPLYNTEFLTPCAHVDPVWMSSDESVVTVSEDGLLTAVKTGEAIIHVYSEYNPEIYDDLTVKVSGGAVSISKKLVDQKDAD